MLKVNTWSAPLVTDIAVQATGSAEGVELLRAVAALVSIEPASTKGGCLKAFLEHSALLDPLATATPAVNASKTTMPKAEQGEGPPLTLYESDPCGTEIVSVNTRKSASGIILQCTGRSVPFNSAFHCTLCLCRLVYGVQVPF